MLKFNIVVDQCAINTSYMLLLKKIEIPYSSIFDNGLCKSVILCIYTL